MLTIFINYYLKLFFIMTPFFVLSSFLAMTTGMKAERRQKIALKVALAVLVSSFALFFFGKYIFALFGITLDAFRIGAGSVLFLSALSMINGRESVDAEYSHNDIAVVPLAIPITVGPGVIGVLMVMGAEVQSPGKLLLLCGALAAASLTIGLLLYSAEWLQGYLGEKSLTVLQKVTGLFVSAIAAQIIFTGIKGFLVNQ
ncbi:MAG: MarC family protein [Sterolibacterium sp.]